MAVILHYLPEFAQIHVHWVGDAIQPSHPLSSPSPPALNPSQHQSLFQWSTLRMRWPKYWSFSFSIIASKEILGLFFRMDWLDLLAVQGILKSLLQHHSSKASILLSSDSSQSILKEMSPGISLEGMMLKLKLQYFGHLMRRVDHWKRLWCWERLGAGGEGDGRGWDGWMASRTRWAWVWVNSGSWWWTGRPGVLQYMGSQRVRYDWATEMNWTELNWIHLSSRGGQKNP